MMSVAQRRQLIAGLLSSFPRGTSLANASSAHSFFSSKEILPESMKAEAQSRLGNDLYRRNFVSAGVEEARILQTMYDGIDDILKSDISKPEVRLRINDILDELDYRPAIGDEGTIKDLRSLRRQNLIIDTNLAIARGYGMVKQFNDPGHVRDFPAMELIRAESRIFPRGDPFYKEGTDGSISWEQRWLEAASAAGDEDAAQAFRSSGRMVALKSSEIWEQLGSLWDDSLGNPWPPFAWGSGMWVEEIDYDDAIALRLINDGETDFGATDVPDIADDFEMDLTSMDAPSLLDLLADAVSGFAVIKKGVLSLTSS
jgi:hypothetical protein